MSAVAGSLQLGPQIVLAAGLMVDSIRRNGKVLACGNGGSAADAQHFACELVGRFREERRGLPALALSTDSSTLTSIANDYGYARVFARQVEALGAAGDVLLAISTSGSSANVVQAAHEAKQKGLFVVAMTGADGGELGLLADICLRASSSETPRIQEVHELIVHCLCEVVEAQLA